jgi:type III restriction enzyme
MNLRLKDFQAEKVDELVRRSHQATRDVREDEGDQGALMLASPTGSGKTVMATAWMERIIEGGGGQEPDEDACFLWITDSPELNEQSRQKVLAASTVFRPEDVVTIDASFDHETFAPGKLYFLNTQKVGKEKYLTTEGDRREFTIWQTVSNTVKKIPASFWVILDEAHKGMMLNRTERAVASTIVQKFLLGSPEIPPIPLVFGISATPQRFLDLLKNSSGRTIRDVQATPDEVRASGLLKDDVIIYHPTEKQPSDWTMLRSAVEGWERYCSAWSDYTTKERDPSVDPILVIQVEDAPAKKKLTTRTNLEKAVDIVEQVVGPLRANELAHSFQEETPVQAGTRSIRYLRASAIQTDPTVRVVFFKRALTTGWDCPRAEVMMSFRRAVDHTSIAQLIGRMVRTPLARTIGSNEFLNSVALYLPHYDSEALNKVISYLQSDEPGAGIASNIRSGAEIEIMDRDSGAGELFAVASALPTYSVDRIPRQSNVRRYLTLARALNYDKLDNDAPDRARKLVVDVLEDERKKRSGKKDDLPRLVADAGEIDLAAVRLAFGVSNGEEGEIKTSTVTIAAAQENIDDLCAVARRTLGEGLHLEYVRRRIDSDGSQMANRAKLELYSLLRMTEVIERLEGETGAALNADYTAYQAGTLKLPESRRAVYRRVRREAKDPEHEPLVLPDSIQVGRAKTLWDGHLFCDENGKYPWDSKSSWEIDVLRMELDRDDVIGWFRNTERKEWALAIPYEFDGKWSLLYPDLLIFRHTNSGILVDILEPHAPSYDDSWAKAVGLGKYAQNHGAHFGRIEMIVKHKDEFVRLDVNNPAERKRILKVQTNQQLKDLYGF